MKQELKEGHVLVSEDQLAEIRLRHTVYMLQDVTEQLGVVRKMLKEAQMSLKAIKEDNKKLREQLKGKE